MSISLIFDDVPPGDGGGGGGTGGGFPGTPPLNALPGLGNNQRPRYTCNIAVSEQVKLVDLLFDAIFVTSRHYLSQSAVGKLRLHNKKPVDFALAMEELAIGETAFDVDDVRPWISDKTGFALIDPHTADAEIRVITSAVYPTSQNSTTLTGSGILTIVGFAGANGASIPATATITVGSFVAGTTYNFALDGTTVEFIPSSSDSTATIASFISMMIRSHPRLSRKFTANWSGLNQVIITARFGVLTVADGLEKLHAAPTTNPTTAPTLSSSAGGGLIAGTYRVGYAWRNAHGQTLLSPTADITVATNEKINVSSVSPPSGFSVSWYVTPATQELGIASDKLRAHTDNNGEAFSISAVPSLNDPLPPDLNRSGTEIMRVMASFSDREESRAAAPRSNVLRATYEWVLGQRSKSINRVDFKYRDSSQDYRLVELRLRNDRHIRKVKKVANLEVNGQGVDNYPQALRLASGILHERRNADFFYRWSSTRKALMLEEGDVVAITDSGSGVLNFPVMIESLSINPNAISAGGLPDVNFVGRQFSNTLYDDSVVDYTIPITPTASSEVPPNTLLGGGEALLGDGEYLTS